MKAVVYRGPHQVAVEDVPDPKIERPTDAIRDATPCKLPVLRIIYIM
jgi:threonine dehydrogenase-like Zn-dependent dehydrogenase